MLTPFLAKQLFSVSEPTIRTHVRRRYRFTLGFEGCY
jgi:hypothetical protein